MKKGFTLIELLVVIAIIGLLSSIVLVGLKNVRGKGSVASGKQFASSLQHTLGSQAVGVWRFDEGSGATAYDNSGYGNNGTLTNGPVRQTDTQCGLGLGVCLQFDGSDDYVNIGDVLGFEGVVPYTISVWANPTTFDGTWRRVVSKHGTVGVREGWLIWTHLSGSTPHIGLGRFVGGAGNEISFVSGSIQSGQWMHIAGTFDGSTSRLYVNGRLVASGVASGSLVDTNIPLAIGRDGGGGSNFVGMIDEVRIYATGLTATQIQQLYAEGRSAYLAARP